MKENTFGNWKSSTDLDKTEDDFNVDETSSTEDSTASELINEKNINNGRDSASNKHSERTKLVSDEGVYEKDDIKENESEELQQEEIVPEVVMDITESDKNKVWAFCAGQYSNDFRGNPKYLFIYMNKYRKDIITYWLCDDIDLIESIREMGYRAYQIGTLEAELAMNMTGVLVSEQVKGFIPRGLKDAKYLNLWHGVGGVKAVERSLTEGVLAFELAKKYIQRNEYYLNHELYLAPSEFIENIACEQLGIDKDKIIRAGYPRNIYQKRYDRISTFDGDLIKSRNLPKDTKIIAYAPTYRNVQTGELFAQAMPDIRKLIEICEKNHLLFIFKMHPLLEKEMSFLQSKETYKDCPWLCFWDNSQDFYEIMDTVDLCIMDYSSIFTDFIASGVKHFIRYIFDIDPDTLDFPLSYDEATLGTKCKSFDELLAALESYRDTDLTSDIERINSLYWEFDDEESMNRIVDETVNFQIKPKELPTLYSFDIFDTLISRKGLAPESIFFKVKEKMEKSELNYPKYVTDNFPNIRKYCESNCREYYNRSTAERDDMRCEIQFSYIYERMQGLYNLTDEQTKQLMDWELEAEFEDTIPLEKQISYVRQLLEKGEQVVLISDMYLPRDFIEKMLAKADPVLLEIPIFLSSEYGYQKSAKTLFLEVYKYFSPKYNFKKWIHHGDNQHSDVKVPEGLNIYSSKIIAPTFNELERTLIDSIRTYDSYLVAANMARFRSEHPLSKEEFVYSYVSLLFVPYIYWAIHDAIERGDEILYFVSRDGHHLKRIADTIIEAEKLDIETKYIYASRRTWRIPSFIDHIDVGFWGQGYGNFGKLSSYNKMLKALDMDEETFRNVFPELSDLSEETEFDLPFALSLVKIFRNSEKYEKYLLAKAAEERVSVCAYLGQEIDQNRQFSIVEYWGRGYTQENFTRLWQQVVGKEVPSVFYYSRSTLPSDEFNIRRNFTCNPNAQQFIEAIFANLPYRSIENYNYTDGKWVPEIKSLDCDFELYESMMRYLPQFAKDYCSTPISDRISLGRSLIDFAINYYTNGQRRKLFIDNLAHLVDSVELYGNKVEYAKELTWDDIELIKLKTPRNQISKSIPMSFSRANEDVQNAFLDKFQLRHGEDTRNGSWLTESEVEKNKEFGLKKAAYKEKTYNLKSAYEKACFETDVENKIIFLYDAAEFNQLSFKYISELLDNQTDYTVEKISTATYKGNNDKFAKLLASARFILLEKAVAKIGGLKFRKETKLIMLGNAACYFQPTGLITPFKLREEREWHVLKSDMDITVLMNPSDKMIPVFDKIFKVNILTDHSLRGSCLTDCYFDEVLREEMKEQLYEVFPEAKGKKVICYVPQNRYRCASACYAQMLDLELMQKHLGDEFVVLANTRKTDKQPISNTIEVPGFSKDMTKLMSIRGQFMVADVIIGDFRDITFEAPLLNKPLFITGEDFMKSVYYKRALFPFEDLAENLMVYGTEDMIGKLKNLDSYDFTSIREFRDEYLTYCDGKSAERLYEYIMERKLNF